MKAVIFLIMIVLSGVKGVYAQQYPQYTQYVLNNYIINPAVAGIENYWDVKLSHRQQWVGVDGAPVTTYLTAHGPLKKDIIPRETATTVHPPGKNPYYKQKKVTIKPHHGIGFTLLNDKNGPFNLFIISGTYAYHLPLTAKINLSIGASVGIQNALLDANNLNYGDGSTYDPAIYGSGTVNKFNPDFSVGLWLYSTKSYFGVSMQNIVSLPLSYSNDVAKPGQLVQHLFVTGGRKIKINDDFTFIPSFLVKYVYPAPVNFDLNVKFQYQDKFWLGTSYRHNDAVAFMAGFNLNSTFNLGYSYDYTTSGLSSASRGTHEILLGILLGNRYKVLCPKFQ